MNFKHLMTFRVYRSVDGRILHTNVYLFALLGKKFVIRNWKIEIWG